MGRNASFRPRKDHAKDRWYISIPPKLSDTGKRQKRFFKSKQEAEHEIQRIKIRKQNHGTAAKLLSPAEEQQAASAFQLLRKAGCTTQLVTIISEYVARISKDKASQPLGFAWDAYMARQDKNIGSVHSRRLQCTKKRFASLLNTPVAALTAQNIESLLEGASPTYRNAMLREIRSVLNWSMGGTRKWLSHNPADDLEFSAVAKGKEVQIYAPGDIQKLLSATVRDHPTLIPSIAILVFAGVRPDHLDGEIVKLEWSHVVLDDAGHERIELPGSITKTAKKRTISIRPALQSWLKWHLQRGGTSEGLVCPTRGQKLRTQMRDIFETAHVTRIQDGFRHTFASYLAPVEGMDRVEQELGHQGGRQLLNKHYRTDVRRAVAERFWALRAPEDEA